MPLAMVLNKLGEPLEAEERSVPGPEAHQLLIKVCACGVCRTDLHLIDGELPNPKLPIIPGHEIVGIVEQLGDGVEQFKVGDRVGVPWLGWTCGTCSYCARHQENLCEQARFTGYQIDGGYAEYTVADARFCFPLPPLYPDTEVAPLLCAGLIGFRSYRKTGDAKRIGFYGFGAAAHILIQIAKYQDKEIYAFTRSGDKASQQFARELGAVWSGDSSQAPPVELDAAIIFAPVGELVPTALTHVHKGGIVVCAGIHMSPIPSFPYEILWGERTICSVANLTRKDGEEFFEIAPKVPVKTSIETFPLKEANKAVQRFKAGKVKGAAVLVMN